MTDCPTCGRDHSGDATICRTCASDLERTLAEIPALATELEVTVTRRARMTTGGGRAATVPLPYDPRASEAAAVLRSTLVGWVRDLAGDPPADDVAAMARWLLARHGRLTSHPAADEVLDEITAAVGQGWHAVDRPAQRVYAGPCDGCGESLYAHPGAAHVRCRTCGAQEGVEERREWMRDQLEDLLGSSSYVAAVCTGLGVTISSSTVRMWVKRHKLRPRQYAPPLREDGEPRPLYRVGDVIRVAAGENIYAA